MVSGFDLRVGFTLWDCGLGFSVGGGNSLFNELHEHLFFSGSCLLFIYFLLLIVSLICSSQRRHGCVLVCCLLLFWTMILENLQHERTGVRFSSPAAGFFFDTQRLL